MPIRANELTKTGIYQAKTTLDAIARDMDEIDALRASRSKQKNVFFTIALVSLLAAVIVLRFSPWVGLPMVVIFAGSLWAGIVAHRSIPAAIDRTNVLKGLATMLGNDAAARAPVQVWMSFDQKGKMISDKKWPVKKNGKERHATCEWLKLETTLLDGTEFSHTVTDYFRDRTHTNPRGKTKKKRRVTSAVVQKYRFAAEIYGKLSAFPEQSARALIRLPLCASVRDVRLSDKGITVKVYVKSAPDLQQSCTMLCLGVYRIFNLARLVAARGTAK